MGRISFFEIDGRGLKILNESEQDALFFIAISFFPFVLEPITNLCKPSFSTVQSEAEGHFRNE